MAAEVVDQRDQHHVTEQAAGEHHGGDANPDQPTNAHEQRRHAEAEGRLVERAEAVGRFGDDELGAVAQELEDRTEQDPAEHRFGRNAAAVTCDQDVGARRALGKGQRVMLLDAQRAAQRDHQQDPQKAADRAQPEHRRRRDLAAEKQQRRHREDDRGRQSLADRSECVDAVVLEDRATPEQPSQHTHRDDGARNGGRHRETDLQPHIGVGRVEDRSQQDAEHHRLQRELGQVLVRPDMGHDFELISIFSCSLGGEVAPSRRGAPVC